MDNDEVLRRPRRRGSMGPAAALMIPVLLAAGALSAAAHAANASLATSRWSIVEMDGKRVGAPAALRFMRVGGLGVQTPCGSLWGWYRQSGPALKIHVAGRGRWQTGYGSPCRGIDYQLLLGRVRGLAFEGDRLLLRSDDGKIVARLIRKQ